MSLDSCNAIYAKRFYERGLSKVARESTDADEVESTSCLLCKHKLLLLVIMVCISVADCQHVHRSALDYFLAVVIVVAVVIAARLLICAVARCLVHNVAGAVQHHHHHHSPTTTDVDDDDVEMWGAGTGPAAMYRHAQQASQQQERRPEPAEPPRAGRAVAE
uniref:Uncharacterized protein n=1 Tax=Oryza brachyantha TaxID=4533 RepID=J3MUW1_ORYBR